MPEKKSEKQETKNENNIVIEIKISIPTIFRGNLSETFDHLKKASEEIVSMSKSVLGKEKKPSVELKKIQVK